MKKSLLVDIAAGGGLAIDALDDFAGVARAEMGPRKILGGRQEHPAFESALAAIRRSLASRDESERDAHLTEAKGLLNFALGTGLTFLGIAYCHSILAVVEVGLDNQPACRDSVVTALNILKANSREEPPGAMTLRGPFLGEESRWRRRQLKIVRLGNELLVFNGRMVKPPLMGIGGSWIEAHKYRWPL